MQFIVIAKDYPDALPRRMEVREAHLAMIDTLKVDGKMLYATALLNDNDQMCGSVVVYDVADRAELDALLEAEPFIVNRVWGDLDIQPCRVPPAFLVG